MDDRKGSLVVVSGFSGAGKGTVVKKLIEKYKYEISVSATTRKPRNGEIDGKHYFFLLEDEFKTKINNDEFFEWAKYCENYYGTPKKFVLDKLQQGKNVILEIEVQGALDIKNQYKDAIMVFILPPSIKELKHRLVSRKTETMDIINKRLKRASEEVNVILQYDYVVTNSIVEKCADDIHSIVKTEQSKVINNKSIIDELNNQFNNIIE